MAFLIWYKNVYKNENIYTLFNTHSCCLKALVEGQDQGDCDLSEKRWKCDNSNALSLLFNCFCLFCFKSSDIGLCSLSYSRWDLQGHRLLHTVCFYTDLHYINKTKQTCKTPSNVTEKCNLSLPWLLRQSNVLPNSLWKKEPWKQAVSSNICLVLLSFSLFSQFVSWAAQWHSG